MSDELKLIHCARCSEIFVQIRTKICPNCIDIEEEEYARIRDVLHNNESINVAKVAELAEVTETCVLRMLDSGLIINEQVNNDVKCGQCGLPAISTSQRLCTYCLSQLDQKFYSEINEAKRRLHDENPNDSVHVVLNRKRNRKFRIDEY